MAKRALITGASGFIGKELCVEAARRSLITRAVVRKHYTHVNADDVVLINAIDEVTDWSLALDGVDVVFHLAARVHVMSEVERNPLQEFRRVNVLGSEHLARAAAAHGVKRFIYVSSVGVHGLFTTGMPFTEEDTVNPHNAYTWSKWEAEQVLRRVAQETGLELVIVRPPLVYGYGAPGNFAQMIKVISRRIPLPLANVANMRSFIYVKNLVDALLVCANHPVAAGKTYLISDGQDISTPDLLRQLGEVMGCHARLFSCPVPLLMLAGYMTGKSAQIERLLGSLQIDNSKICSELNWSPPYDFDQGLRETASAYIK